MDPDILVLITLVVGVVTVLFLLSRNESDKAETDDQVERAPVVRNLNRPRANKPQIKFKLITSNACSSIPRQKTSANTTDSIFFDEWTNFGTHRLESLKCGHLFDESNIKRPKPTPELNEPQSYSQTILTAIPLTYPITAQNTAIPLSVPTTSKKIESVVFADVFWRGMEEHAFDVINLNFICGLLALGLFKLRTADALSTWSSISALSLSFLLKRKSTVITPTTSVINTKISGSISLTEFQY